MGLFNLFSKKQTNSTKQTNSFGESIDRLTPEGELPWGWVTANKAFVDQIQAEAQEFVEAWVQSEGKDVLKEYAALKSYILYLKDAKALCISKGECFAKWFSDIIASDGYMDKCASKLKFIEDNIDDLLEKEKRRKKKV